VKPVLFIPGFPGSELRDSTTKATVFPPALSTLIDPAKKSALIQRLIKVPGDLEAGPPIRDILGVAKEAQSLYDILSGKFKYDTSNLSADFSAIGWDWRLGISHAAVIDKLAAEVSRLSTGGRKIVAMVHSTGGLVFRSFLAARPDLISRFEQVMAFGVPWNGTLEALYAITKAQAAYDLLPPGVLADPSWMSADYMRNLAASAHGSFPRNFDDLPVTNVCGWGIDTWTSRTWDHSKDAGDGTVPIISSSWIRGANVRTVFLPIGAYAAANIPYAHSRIWDSPPVLQLFEEILNNAPRSPFLCAAADSDDYIDYNADVDVRFSADVPSNVTVDLGGSHIPVAINGEGRGAFILKRAGIQHNVGSDIFRFTVTFRWNGGQVSRAVLIKSV